MPALCKEPYQSPLTVMVRWWRNLIGNHAARSEIDGLDRFEKQTLARDIGASTSELRSLAGKWPDSASALERRMAALRIDPTKIARALPAVTNDMRKLCSLCTAKQRCEHDLDTGSIHPSWRQYCPNSDTLGALRQQREQDEEAGK